MNRATGLVGRALLLAALCAPAAAAVRGDGADCGRLLAAPQRSTWIWHPADPQRGVLVVDDGRVLAITREITAATTGQVPAAARLARPWPEADCPGSALPPPDLPLTLPEGAAAALVDAVAQAEDHETAARRPRGLEERAEHWRAALERLRSVWTDVGATGQAVLERLAAHALMAAADGGALPPDVAPLEQRWRALVAKQGVASHASLEALTELLWTLEVVEQFSAGANLLEPAWPAIGAALPQLNRQRLRLATLRLRLRASGFGAGKTVDDAAALLPEARQALPRGDPLRMDAELIAARVLLAAGRRAEALNVLQTLAADAGAQPSRRAALVQDRLSTGYLRAGRLSEGLLAAQRAYRITFELVSPTHRDALRAANNYADSLRQLGDFEAALPFARQAFEGYRRLYGDGHPNALIAARNVSLQLGELKRVAEALAIVQPQVQAAAASLPADHPQLLNTRIHLIELLDLLGSHVEAVAMGEAVLDLTERRFGPDGELTIVTYTLLAGAHAGAGQTARALGLLAVAAARIGHVDDQRRALALLEQAARTAERTGDEVRHEQLLERFVALAERTDRSGLSEDTASWVQEFRGGPHLRWTVLRAQRGEVDAAFDLSERFKGRVLLATLGQIAGDSSATLPEATRRDLALARQGVRDAEAAFAAARDPTARVAAGEHREAAAQAYMARRERARREHPRFAAVSDAPVLGSRDVGKVLAPGTCMLSFVTAAEHAGVFVLANGQAIRWRPLPAPSLIEALVVQLREAWGSGGSRAPTAGDAAMQMAALLAPALGDCPARTRRLAISPDGALALLPLEPLTVDGHRLADRYAISYVQSFSVLALLQRRGAPKGDRALLGIGAPSYAAERQAVEDGVPPQALRAAALNRAAATLASDPQAARRAFDALGKHWEPLPGAERELRHAGRLFDRSDLWVGHEASEERLAGLNDRGELARYRLLLFSAHGYLSYTHPQLSAIVLRQPGSDRHDGYLTAAELPLYRMDSQLVVLAACETGVGPVRSGGGVMGLPLALMVAGNRNAVVSLWSVPDRGTSELVTRLFIHLRQGLAPAEALARSKRELARQPRFSHPLHWAGFVLYGTP